MMISFLRVRAVRIASPPNLNSCRRQFNTVEFYGILLSLSLRSPAAIFSESETMNRLLIAVSVVCSLGFSAVGSAQDKKVGKAYPPKLPGAEVEAYKTVDDTKLNLY